MSLYGRIFAALYDRSLAAAEKKGLRAARARTVSAASGRVIEIGAGTGLNLAHYPPAVDELVLTEPEGPMASRLEARVAELRPGTEVVRAPAEALPFPDDRFDTAVCGLVLCTVGNLDAALREIRRVLVPGGTLLFLEHVRNDENPSAAAWQDRLHRPWKAIGHGCNCNRRTVPAIAAAGFADVEAERVRVAVPALVRPVVSGRATA